MLTQLTILALFYSIVFYITGILKNVLEILEGR